ncbi:MAG: PrsW family intramembrane metalloprotease [Muribaculaceae bacterium]|nr:PrsW family intramembrane metalloprotease [Muribaculaceae bacterium]
MLLSAVLPALILIYYIYRRDTVKEPTGQLVKGFGLGMISGLVAGVLEGVIAVVGLVTYEPQSFLSALNTAFVGAALPEELVKLAMLCLLVRHNRWFDEWMDGVVYAVSIGMGFAAIENIGYVMSEGEQWMHIALMRGITAVPAHFAFAVIMGFFFSLVRIGGRHTRRDRVMVLAGPVLAHGAYDGILMAADTVPTGISAVFSLLFIGLLIWLVRICRRYIRTLRAFDTMPR